MTDFDGNRPFQKRDHLLDRTSSEDCKKKIDRKERAGESSQRYAARRADQSLRLMLESTGYQDHNIRVAVAPGPSHKSFNAVASYLGVECGFTHMSLHFNPVWKSIVPSVDIDPFCH